MVHRPDRKFILTTSSSLCLSHSPQSSKRGITPIPTRQILWKSHSLDFIHCLFYVRSYSAANECTFAVESQRGGEQDLANDSPPLRSTTRGTTESSESAGMTLFLPALPTVLSVPFKVPDKTIGVPIGIRSPLSDPSHMTFLT